MKAFEWTNPASINDAVKMLGGSAGDIDEAPRPIAGGQDLLTTMKDYTSRPVRLVNLKNISGLNSITLNARGLTIGALVTLTELEEHAGVRKSFPGLAEAAHSIATPQIRNLGTVGGNLCQRPRCWYFRLEEVNCLKKGGSECYAAKGENKYNAIIAGGPSYIVHPCENVLQNDDIITQINVPASAVAAKSTYLKFKERESLDFALASAAVALRLGPNEAVRESRIVLGGVAPIPWRVPAAEKFLVGKKLTPDVLAETAKIALAEAKPLEKNAYKVPLAQTLVRRALAKAANVPASV
jgi:xanthine dehydrogenase YagS FAD-binding subunit